MYIEKLEIKGFGKFNSRVLNLSKGLNVVIGRNESGKTTLQWFIRAMLFGLKGGRQSKEGVPPPLKRFKPWGDNLFGGFMEYRLDDGSWYRIERNFDTGAVRVFDSSFNDITAGFDFGKDKSIRLAEKHLGLNEACFEKTVLVRQLASKPEEDGNGELVSRLVNAAQTGFEDLSFPKACNALKEALKQHVGTGRTTTRPLDRAAGRIEELKTQRKELATRMDSMLEVQKKLKEIHAQREQVERQRTLLSACREAGALKRELAETESKRVELAQVAEEAEALEKQVGRFSGNFQTPGRRQDAERIKALRRMEKTRLGRNVAMGAAGVLTIAAVLLVIYTQANGRSGGMLPWGAAGSAIMAAAVGALLMRSMKRLQAAFEEQERQAAESSRSMLELLELNNSLKDKCNKASLLYGRKVDCSRQALEAVNDISEREALVRRKLHQTIHTGRTLLSEPSAAEAIRTASFFPWEQLEHGNVGQSELAKLEDEVKTRLGSLEREAGEINLKVREYETLLLGADTDALQRLDEELAELEDKKRRLEDANTSIQIALQMLTESGMEIQRDYVPALGSRMSHIITQISGGRYSDLRADDKLAIKTASPETGEIISAEILSGGTIDQMYLALRIAMADLITAKGEKLPYILDEALAQYDDERTLEAFRFLTELGENGQVVFFTCKEREADIAVKVCSGKLNLIRL